MQTVRIGFGGAIPRPLVQTAGRCARALAVVSLAWLLLPPASAVADTPLSAWGMSKAKIGTASWYGHEFARRRTASGERFNPHGLTGAHRTLPLGTKVLVTNLRNGRTVLVTITDRGPYLPRREIDLSLGAARALDMVERGVTRVKIEPLES
jgi:rare lipoprotein A